MEFYRHTLSNGLRLIHKPINGPIAHLGWVINAGSRDETPGKEGLAHFIEHAVFKGTQKRKAFHILNRMEVVGGEVNAYTGKEDTTFYATFLPEYYPRAMELLKDLVFQATFPEREIVKEKEVIIDEIHSYEDNPSDLIFDEFDQWLFPDHSLGHPILGTPESVRNLTRGDALAFIQQHYTAPNLVLASVGNMSPKRFFQLAERHLGHLTLDGTAPQRTPAPDFIPFVRKTQRVIHQTHAVLGGRACSAYDDRFTALAMMNNILGGPGMNSRLNLNIREKYGFTYHIESFYHPFTDNGTLGIYLGTEAGSVDRALRLVEREMRLLREKALTTLQLQRAKTQILGQLAMAQENNSGQMMALGKSYLMFDKVETFEEIRQRVDAVTPSDILEVANQYLDRDQMGLLIYKPQ
jgi:predicted Zn-dependent peptidase